MRFHDTLDDLLGNRTKVKLLRAFFAYPEKEFSESDLQRIAGIPQASVHRNSKSLSESGLLERKRIGKANIYRPNPEHILHDFLKNCFACEGAVLMELKKAVAEAIKNTPSVKLAVLFGSVAKGTERADSDIDIFIVCKENKQEVEDELEKLTQAVRNRFGNATSLMVKNENELKELKAKSIYKELKKGEMIFKQETFEW